MTWSQRAFLEISVPPRTSSLPSSLSSHQDDESSYRLFRFIDHRDPRHSHLLSSLPQPVQQHNGEWCRCQGSSSKNAVAVVYVPGHVGSYQQARSLGAHGIQLTRYEYAPSQQALALRKLASHRWNGTAVRLSDFVYDVYTVDFQEEPTGLHGAFVQAQASFVQRVIQHLSSSCHELSQIMIVAHSMAGYVAQLALSDELFLLLSSPLQGPMQHQQQQQQQQQQQPDATTRTTAAASRVRNLITLGTPHAHPVLAWDITLHQIHQRLLVMRQQLQEERDGDTDLALISISGGIRDEMIPPNACDISKQSTMGRPTTTTSTRYRRTKNTLTLLATDIMTPRKEKSTTEAAAATTTTTTTSSESTLSAVAHHHHNFGLGMDHRAIVWCHNLLRPLRGVIHALAVPQTNRNGATDPVPAVEFVAEHRVNQVRSFVSSLQHNLSFEEDDDESDVYATAVERQKRRFEVSLRSCIVPSLLAIFFVPC